MESKNPWRKNVERTIQELNIEIDELLSKSKLQTKKFLTSKLKEYQISKIYKAAEDKSRKAVMEKPDYIDKLSRRECSSKKVSNSITRIQGIPI